MQRILIPAIIIIAVATTYGIHLWIRKKTDPAKSFGHLILYLILHMALIFLVVFAVSFLIFRFSNPILKK